MREDVVTCRPLARFLEGPIPVLVARQMTAQSNGPAIPSARPWQGYRDLLYMPAAPPRFRLL